MHTSIYYSMVESLPETKKLWLFISTKAETIFSGTWKNLKPITNPIKKRILCSQTESRTDGRAGIE